MTFHPEIIAPRNGDGHSLTQINKERGFASNIIVAQGKEIVMKHISWKRAMLVAAVVACSAGSVDWSSNGIAFFIGSAQARVGRPLTPVSVAGVARRTTRRAVVGGAVVGGAAVGCVRVLVNGRYVCR
jgi:hypothetical protein